MSTTFVSTFMNTEMGDGTPIHRVDYGKYLSGAENYYYKKTKNLQKNLTPPEQSTD